MMIDENYNTADEEENEVQFEGGSSLGDSNLQ